LTAKHLLYNGDDPSYQGLNPQDPSSLVYAINVPNHAPILPVPGRAARPGNEHEYAHPFLRFSGTAV
jgi:hypothetical protein